LQHGARGVQRFRDEVPPGREGISAAATPDA